jgi:hypothetical protein
MARKQTGPQLNPGDSRGRAPTGPVYYPGDCRGYDGAPACGEGWSDSDNSMPPGSTTATHVEPVYDDGNIEDFNRSRGIPRRGNGSGGY